MDSGRRGPGTSQVRFEEPNNISAQSNVFALTTAPFWICCSNIIQSVWSISIIAAFDHWHYNRSTPSTEADTPPYGPIAFTLVELPVNKQGYVKCRPARLWTPDAKIFTASVALRISKHDVGTCRACSTMHCSSQAYYCTCSLLVHGHHGTLYMYPQQITMKSLRFPFVWPAGKPAHDL